MFTRLMSSNLSKGVIDAMRQLKEMGYALVVVTNQSVSRVANLPKRNSKR